MNNGELIFTFPFVMEDFDEFSADELRSVLKAEFDDDLLSTLSKEDLVELAIQKQDLAEKEAEAQELERTINNQAMEGVVILAKDDHTYQLMEAEDLFNIYEDVEFVSFHRLPSGEIKWTGKYRHGGEISGILYVIPEEEVNNLVDFLALIGYLDWEAENRGVEYGDALTALLNGDITLRDAVTDINELDFDIAAGIQECEPVKL